MSSYHLRVSSNNEEGLSFDLPEEVVVSLENKVESMRQGLLAFCVSAGLGVFNEILEAEVEALVRPKGKPKSDRQAFRHGRTRGNRCWVDGRFKYSVPELGTAMPIRRFLWNLTGCFRTRISC